MAFKNVLRPIFEKASILYSAAARTGYPRLVLSPLRLTVVITSRCNLGCWYCNVQQDLNKPEARRLTSDEWDRIVDSLPRRTLVSFTGGEPFLAPDIYHILKALFDRGNWVSVVTNGTVLTEPKIEFLVDGPLRYIGFSIDGLRDYHDKARGREGTFDKAVEAIRTFSRIREQRGSMYPVLAVKTNITPDNADQIPAIVDLAENSLSVDELYFNMLIDNPLQYGLETTDSLQDPRMETGNTFTYPPDQHARIQSAIDDVLKQRARRRVKIGFTQVFKHESDTSTFVNMPNAFGVPRCNKPWSEYTLFYDGTVSPCITYRICNIRDLDYNTKRVLKHPNYTRFLEFYGKEGKFFPPCEGCCGVKHAKKPGTPTKQDNGGL